MGASAGSRRCGAGCEGCADRDAVIAGLEAERDAAVRSEARMSRLLALERRGREATEARLQEATDRLEFVWPMYAAVRARYEELYGRYGAISKRCVELEGENAEIGGSLALVKRQAARAVALETRNAELEDYVARGDHELRRVLAELQRHVKGRVVYPPGPNTPPSEDGGQGERQDGAGGSGRALLRRRGSGKPKRKIPKRPGGRKGHRGHGVSFDPNPEEADHRFPRRADGSLDMPECPCGGGCWRLIDGITRMIRDIEFVVRDTRRSSERVECTGCGAEAWASDGIVPRSGAYGANLVALIVLLRDNNVKYHAIASILADLFEKRVISKAAAIEAYGRAADMHREESEAILLGIEGSATAGGDETRGAAAYTRLTAEVADLTLMSEYIRGALPALAGGRARASLSVVLTEEPALPALPAPGGGALPVVPAEEPALPAAPGGDASSAAMDWILAAAAESASGLRKGGGGDAADAADAAVAIALDSIGAAFLNATVGTEVGARAEEAGQDGSPNGIAWLWVFHNTRSTAYRSALTRAAMVPERHMGRFEGTLVVDKYAVYPKVFGGNEIQWCWAHELRHARSDALLPDATGGAGELAAEIGGAFAMAKHMLEANGGQRSHGLRVAMESELGDLLDRHAASADPVVAGMVGRVRRSLPHLFVFLEYDVDPTNNRSELPLRRPVAFRKSSQQCKGGRKSMGRTDHMSTCSRTWRDEGKSVFREVRRTVLEHGTPWRRRPRVPGLPRPGPTGPGPPAARAG